MKNLFDAIEEMHSANQQMRDVIEKNLATVHPLAKSPMWNVIQKMNDSPAVKVARQMEQALGPMYAAVNTDWYWKIYNLGKGFIDYAAEEEDMVSINVDMERRVEVASPEFAAVYMDEHKRMEAIVLALRAKNTHLKNLTPREFEDLVAELFRRMNFDVKQTKQTRDGGFDMIAFAQGPANSPLKYVIECKHWNAKVDVSVVRAFKTVVSEQDATKGFIVTSSSFTRDAIKETEKKRFIIDLKEGKDIIEWIAKY